MRIQIRRVKRAENHHFNRLDTKFVNGTIESLPKEGESLTVQFDKLGYGTWYTTPVVERSASDEIIILKTTNSTYHIKFGWEEN